MNCEGCGYENPEAAKFCGDCGGSLSRTTTCPSCAAENPADQKFCNGCGQKLGAPVSEPRSPRDYTPQHLADKILQSKSALEGERKQLTVLFADLKSSVELSGQVDAEEWHRILDRYFQILTDAVHRFEGTVNQYTGDGIMALFGAPIAHEDHARRACYAVLQMREELDAYTTELKRSHGIGISTRAGLHSGEVVVGRIGDDLRMDYTAQGHTVGIAQRMEALASPDTCFMSGATADLVTGFLDVDDLGPFELKGVQEPVTVHRLVGMGTAHTRFDVSRARGLTRFVGRDADVRTLDDALDQARAGNGQVLGVVAEAGTGKSRLCFEFVERCRSLGIDVLEGSAVAHGQQIPFLPVLQIFRTYFGILDRDDPRTAREKIAGRVLLLDEAFREMLPLLFDFFGVPDAERPAPRIDAQTRQRQLFEVMRRVNQHEDGEQPRVTLIEDLHWLDSASEAFIAQMSENVAETRSLLLLNFRPEYRANWMNKSWYRQLALAPLRPEAIRELIADWLGDDPSTEGVAKSIHARTGGNPFFAEEVIQNLIEGGKLEGARGHYRLTTPIEAIDVPPNVQSLLAARIDRLSEREKQVLQTASVIGKEFEQSLLAEVAGLETDELEEALRALVRGEFLYELSLFPVAEYAFKHPLTQEVALGSLLRERRERIHAALAQSFSRGDQAQLDERAALISQHLEQAGNALEAGRWGDRAASWAMTRDFAEAGRQAQRVVRLLEGAPESEERDRVELSARSHLLQMNWRVRLEPVEARNNAQRIRTLAERLGDERALATMLSNHALHRVFQENEGGLEELAEAIELADRSGDLSLRIGVRTPLAIYFGTGKFAEGVRAAEEIIELADGDATLGHEVFELSPLLFARLFAPVMKAFTSNGAAGLAELESVWADVQRAGDHQLKLVFYDWKALLASQLGDSEAAEAAFRLRTEGIAQIQAEDAATTAGHSVKLLRERGESVAAVQLGEEELARLPDGNPNWVYFAAETARAALDSGDPQRAMALTIEIERQLEGTPSDSPNLVWLLLNLAALHCEIDAPRNEVSSLLDRAAQAAARMNAVLLAPQVQEARARLAHREDEDAADALLRGALQGYHEVGAYGHAQRLEQELGI